MRKTIPINDVQPDIDPNESIGLFNPLDSDFTCSFGGKDFTIKAGKKQVWPNPVALHVGKHLADKIVRDNLNSWLQKKFTGLTDDGREKWRTQIQIASTKEDVLKVRDELLFAIDELGNVEVKKPEVNAPVEEKAPDVVDTTLGERPTGAGVAAALKERKANPKAKAEKPTKASPGSKGKAVETEQAEDAAE